MPDPKCGCGLSPADHVKGIGENRKEYCSLCWAELAETVEMERKREVIVSYQKAMGVMRECSSRLRAAGIVPDKLHISTWDVEIRIADHATALKVTGMLGDLLKVKNKWARKQPSEYTPRLEYRGRTKALEDVGGDIVILGVEPPPSCRIEEEIVDVPARQECRFRVLCAPVDEKKEER